MKTRILLGALLILLAVTSIIEAKNKIATEEKMDLSVMIDPTISKSKTQDVITSSDTNTVNLDKIYTLMKMTGDTTLNGIMISKGSTRIIKGLSENQKREDQCIVAAGQYYPSADNSFGEDGNFMSKIYLSPQLAEKEMKPECRSDIAVKKDSVYYFIALTGEGWYQMLYNNELHNCLDSPNFPVFKQPKVDEWFKVSCQDSLGQAQTKKIWIKLDDKILDNKNVCKLIASAPDYGSGLDAPDIKGGCKL